jgi:uncharacterized membrane protein YcaP (DUF421 family)
LASNENSFKDGQFNSKQMSAALITRTDVFETARQELHPLDLEEVQLAILERNGQVSLIREKPDTENPETT